MSRPRYDLAIFDVDGTLLATDAFWLDIGVAAVAKVFRRHGVDDAPPPPARLLEAMGLPMRAFWDYVLPASRRALGPEIESEAQDLERVAFAAGHGAMYPGARDLLAELAESGMAVALASNCSRRYLDGFVDAFRLRGVVSSAYCAESAGVGSKADMVREILGEAQARRPVMIGDRSGDRDAAAANRVPFVLFTGGFGATPCAAGDLVARDYDEVRALLLE
jgi:phosphoglycolate phosphatase-like HAD superfamily hydrolase